ncbi:16607_t:CDS:2, partial [Gigaspora rosea]
MVLSRKHLLILVFLAIAFVMMASAKPSLNISKNGEKVFGKQPMLLVSKKKLEPSRSIAQAALPYPIATQSTHTYEEEAYPTYQTTTDDDDYNQPTVVVAGNTSKPSIIVVSGPAGNSVAEEQTSMGCHQKSSALII